MTTKRASYVLWTVLAIVLSVNIIAYMQARAMTHFTQAGQRTEPPERLSVGAKIRTVLSGVTIPRPENHHTPADLKLPYAVHWIHEPDGTRLEGWIVPYPDSHGVVLLFHAYAVSKETLLAPASAFHELGYDTLLLDFRGSGGSSGHETSLGVREGTDVAWAVIYTQHMWPGKPIILYGVSMGAVAILRAIATAGVAPAAIILESPFDRLDTAVTNRVRAMGLPGFPVAELLVFWGSMQEGFDGFAHNPVDYATTVRCPALLLLGDEDARVTIAQGTHVFDKLHEPKQLVRFPHANHEFLLLEDPVTWRRHVMQFLESVKQHV
ncbi:MAG: alpha/beta fold hydrolase [Herpetosiphonaceae bacterium]|nr:alpha/beta fold hydrolase [Herpetosiphonaceae bacterium]